MACSPWFQLTVLYRLYNEVWSNTVVIADFFGESLSSNWKLAAWVSMAIPAAYTFIGGMRASLYSDALQAVLMCVLLVMTWLAILTQINGNDELQAYAKANHESSSLWTYNPVQGREMFSLEGGMDLFWTGILQGALSYTFMDPALTDRAFLASKEVMVSGFALGCVLAVAYVTVFGFIGVYGNMLANCVSDGACSESDLNGADVASVMGGEPSAVATVLGPAYYSVLCLVIITSAMSTLDSTFTAVAKAIGPDLHGFIVKGRPVNPSEADAKDVVLGRIAIVVIGVTGTLPLLFDPDELDATTVTGTMVKLRLRALSAMIHTVKRYHFGSIALRCCNHFYEVNLRSCGLSSFSFVIFLSNSYFCFNRCQASAHPFTWLRLHASSAALGQGAAPPPKLAPCASSCRTAFRLRSAPSTKWRLKPKTASLSSSPLAWHLTGQRPPLVRLFLLTTTACTRPAAGTNRTSANASRRKRLWQTSSGPVTWIATLGALKTAVTRP